MKIVFGESAGAMSIGSLLVADGGKAVKRLNLFRGAIMESGAPSGYVISGGASVWIV
jgi:carboxylesterase type B